MVLVSLIFIQSVGKLYRFCYFPLDFNPSLDQRLIRRKTADYQNRANIRFWREIALDQLFSNAFFDTESSHWD